MQNGTLGALVLAFTHPACGRLLDRVHLPQVALAKYANDVKFEDVVMSSLTFEASKPLTGGSQYTVQAVISNSVSTAY